MVSIQPASGDMRRARARSAPGARRDGAGTRTLRAGARRNAREGSGRQPPGKRPPALEGGGRVAPYPGAAGAAPATAVTHFSVRFSLSERISSHETKILQEAKILHQKADGRAPREPSSGRMAFPRAVSLHEAPTHAE